MLKNEALPPFGTSYKQTETAPSQRHSSPDAGSSKIVCLRVIWAGRAGDPFVPDLIEPLFALERFASDTRRDTSLTVTWLTGKSPQERVPAICGLFGLRFGDRIRLSSLRF